MTVAHCASEGDVLSTNILSLDRSIQIAVQWIVDVQTELEWDSRDETYKATKAVLHAIRDRLPIEEVLHLSSNLPVVLKGMILDGYDLKDKPLRIKSPEEFYDYVQQNYDPKNRDIIDAEAVTNAVIAVLNRRIGSGEMQKVAGNMPEKIKRLFETESKPKLLEEPAIT